MKRKGKSRAVDGHRKCFKGTEKIGKTSLKVKKKKFLISDLTDEEESD